MKTTGFLASWITVGMLLSGACWGQEEFLGTWDITADLQGRTIESVLVLEQADDGSLTGTYTGMQGTSEISDANVADGTLTFSRELDFQGQSMALDYEASIEDGKLVGEIVTPQGSLPFTGTRQMASVDDYVGKWDVSMEFQGTPVNATLDLAKDDAGALKGTWEGRRGPSELSNIKVERDKLMFTRTLEFQGQSFDLDHQATLSGDTLNGTIDSPRGSNPFTAKRTAPAEAAGPALPERLLALDANGDGKIQKDEAPEQMVQYFDMIDSNGDGAVDAAEFEVVMQMRQQQQQ